MTIEAKLDGDSLTINIVDLLSSLTGEQEQQLIEQLSCSDTVIEHVASQIMSGATENNYSGWISDGAAPSTPLEKAIRKVAESSSAIANDEITALQNKAARYFDQSEEWQKRYFDLYHEGANK